ncbi:right-handed parallel beta-helix repeat-containing protein [Nocardioides pelophilus]|uniref:right-handed parallel beta-helix repeat-containing protein n=1 Tax=Nocardioides pelophilus TaxID=2172019 RepID=UPI0016039A8B|nr:right-handed parallel beta-helix repeat-containing protein [Nocardioides pelophilus]
MSAVDLSAATVFTVTTPFDSGPGSLREAILAANEAGAPAVVELAIGSGPVTLRPESPLPPIRFPGLVDGWSQPGSDRRPVVELSGLAAGQGQGLEISGGPLTVRGLAITGWTENGVLVRHSDEVELIGLMVSGNGGHGILVQTSDRLRVEGCRLGTDADGEVAVPNRGSGIKLYESGAATIGGAQPGAGNIVSGNGRYGIEIGGVGSAGAVVVGNLVGTDATGSRALPNNRDGVVVHSSPDVRIGGTTPGERNVISGNNLYGVEIIAPDAHGARILGNYVGVDASGCRALPNGRSGVLIYNTAHARIGGLGPGEGNVISGGARAGINLDGSVREGYPWTGVGEAHSNVVEGNLIGVDVTGEGAVGNLLRGILVNHTQDNLIVDNVISANTQDGVLILGPEDDSDPNLVPSGNRVLRNRIGITASGQPCGNGRHGVFVRHGKNNYVGGDTEDDANVIASNGARGVMFSGVGATSNHLGESNDLRDNTLGPFFQRE